MTDEVSKLKEYKGNALPSPIIPIGGFVMGIALPLAFKSLSLGGPGKHGMDGFIHWLQFAPSISGLFFSEFVIGAVARGTSNRAALYPAAAAAVNEMPLVLVRNNRIHQNHIEALALFLPSVLSASVVDSSLAIACTFTWIVARLFYRMGYCYQENPFWRIFGVSASALQAIVCATIGMKLVSI